MLHTGHQREELDGKKLTRGGGGSFVYLGGAETGRRRAVYVEEHRPERTRGEELKG